jgi:hypothetical protein
MEISQAPRLVRIRCDYPAPDRPGRIVAQAVDRHGQTHFVLLQPRDGGLRQKFAVDAAGKLVEPPLEDC